MVIVNNKSSEPLKYDGGSIVINRLMKVFGVRSRPQLEEFIGVTAGTMSTWQTRTTTPYEILIRVSLTTGVNLKWLCFGEGEMYSNSQSKSDIENLPLTIIENSQAVSEVKVAITDFIPKNANKNSIHFFKLDDCMALVDTSITNVINGKYLFTINGNYQIGELRLLPDGHIYLIDNNDKYQVDQNTTNVLGKVIAIYQKQ